MFPEPAKNILIIEDNLGVALMLSLLIENAGLGSTTAISDGLQGLAVCFQTPPDAVVLDLELPSLRGEDICRLMRSAPTHKHIPILIVSELADSKRREMELLGMGADAYFEKPVCETLFLNQLRTLLTLPKAPTPPPATPSDIPPHLKAFISTALQLALEDEKPSESAPIAASPGTPSTLIGTEGDAGNQEEDTVTDSGEASLPVLATCDMNSVFAGYQIRGIIGSGGMGTVYKAEQISLRRMVALKVLLEHFHQSHEVRTRFQREGMIMAQVNHPNIVQVYDIGQTEHTSFIAMEYVNGHSLDVHIRNGWVEWEECIRIVEQTCGAVAHLHDRGIIHRDIKPSNIVISTDGLVKITDFGISRARLVVDKAEFTQALQFMGTPDYMAPELRRLEPASFLTDQYALGMTLWKMLAGTEAKQLGRPLIELHPELPPAVSEAIARSIHKDPEKRFPSVAAMRDALRQTMNIPPVIT